MNEINFTIRGCPKSVREAIAESAKYHRRSSNAETLTWLEEKARTLRRRMSPKELIRRIEASPCQTSLSAEEMRVLIREGRP
jgi:hypothetical protein